MHGAGSSGEGYAMEEMRLASWHAGASASMDRTRRLRGAHARLRHILARAQFWGVQSSSLHAVTRHTNIIEPQLHSDCVNRTLFAPLCQSSLSYLRRLITCAYHHLPICPIPSQTSLSFRSNRRICLISTSARSHIVPISPRPRNTLPKQGFSAPIK